MKNILLSATTIIITLLVCEVILRVFFPPPPVFIYPQETYKYDKQIGHVLIPNQKSFTHNYTVLTNSHGLRDKEFAQFPEENIYRVLAIGDSQTFGNGLKLEDTWPKQLEANLGSQSEVINGGLAASDTWQHELILERLLPKYNPKVVVLAIYINDIRRKPSKQKANAASIEVNEFRERAKYLLKRSLLVLLSKKIIDSFTTKAGAKHFENIMTGNETDSIKKAWADVENSLRQMKVMTSERNVKFMAVILPRRDQVIGAHKGVAYNLKLQEILGRNNIMSIDMLDAMKSAYATYGSDMFISWDGHNSKITNKLIAAEIKKALKHNSASLNRSSIMVVAH